MTTPSEEYRLIPLTQGQFAIIDAADFEWLSQWKWQAHFDPARRSFTAMRSVSVGHDRQEAVYMHRFILGLNKGDPRKGDHANHNTLDNRRSNLRAADNFQNAWNRRKKLTSNAPYKNVGFHPTTGKWRARITVNGKRRALGLFSTPEQAYEAWKKAAAEAHGQYACFI